MSRSHFHAAAPDKERFIAALKGEKTDQVPYFENLIEGSHVAKLLGREGAGNTLGVGGNPAKGAVAAEGVRPMFPKDYMELCEVIGQDVIIMESAWTPIKQRTGDGRIVKFFDRSFKSGKDLDRVVWPDEADMEERLQYVREYVRAVEGTRIGVALLSACMFQTIYEFVIGLNDCLVILMEEREVLERLMEGSAAYYAKLHEKAIEIGIDVLYVADDFAFNKGLFVRPELFEQIWRPYAARVFQPALDAGIPILFHSDGRIDDAVEMLIDMGVDGINPMDPSGVDYADYKKRFGHRVTLSGNIDITFPLVKGTPEDVRADVKKHMDVLKPGGRYIAASSHSIVDYVPHENYLAMVEAIHEFGRY